MTDLRHRLRRPSLPAACAALLVVLVTVSSPCLLVAAEGKSQNPPRSKSATDKRSESQSLDDALLKDLDNELLEGAGALRDRPKPKPQSPNPAASDKDADVPPPPAEAAGEDIGMPSEDADPLARIGHKMRSLEGLIPRPADQERAEQLQKGIVEDLRKLIEEAQRRSAQQSAAQKSKRDQQTAKRQNVKQPGQQRSAGKASNKPAADSTDRLGKAEAARPDPEMLKGLMKDAWGRLPEHAREQMLQNSPERFLPQYELLIERYYKRLAEQQSAK